MDNSPAPQRAAANAAGQAHSYNVVYDPSTGRLTVARDGTWLGSWTDPTAPLQSGAYLALRTDSANVLFDNLAVSDYVKYYELGGTRVALRNAGGLSYLLGDHLGSTNVTANAAGTWSGELLYQPWGTTRYSSGVLLGIVPHSRMVRLGRRTSFLEE